jgi:hypothetical protein
MAFSFCFSRRDYILYIGLKTFSLFVRVIRINSLSFDINISQYLSYFIVNSSVKFLFKDIYSESPCLF